MAEEKTEKKTVEKKESKYVTVSYIKEDGKKIMPGDEYKGKNFGKFLDSGQIKKG